MKITDNQYKKNLRKGPLTLLQNKQKFKDINFLIVEVLWHCDGLSNIFIYAQLLDANKILNYKQWHFQI